MKNELYVSRKLNFRPQMLFLASPASSTLQTQTLRQLTSTVCPISLHHHLCDVLDYKYLCEINLVP